MKRRGNIIIKFLTAVALISVIIACGTYTISKINNNASAGVETRAKSSNGTYSNIAEAKTENDSDMVVPERLLPKYADEIRVSSDDDIASKYVPVNNPKYLQVLREEGKTYNSSVLGKVSGWASKKDWGMVGMAYFNYVYSIMSQGYIKKNDGLTIIEERSFGKVTESITVNKYELSFEIPDELATACAALEFFFGSDGSMTAFAKGFLDNVKIPINDGIITGLKNIGIVPDSLDPEKLKNEMLMFTKSKDSKLLEGKKVRIEYKDGQGIVSITPMDGCVLSAQEIDVIKRTNFVVDHYIFPDKQVEPDDEWQVPSGVFSGFLDPRMVGKIDGSVTVSRLSDFIKKEETYNRLRFKNGIIQFVSNSSSSSEITGQITGVSGGCNIPLSTGVVSDAILRGNMEYKNVSKDHLLFEARTTTSPVFEVRYQCEVK